MLLFYERVRSGVMQVTPSVQVPEGLKKLAVVERSGSTGTLKFKTRRALEAAQDAFARIPRATRRGAFRFRREFRWFRSFLAGPPANFFGPSETIAWRNSKLDF
jgi:hypothetical protein